jgi:hypothetical protein
MPQQYPGFGQLSPQYYYFPGASSGYPSMSYGAGGSVQAQMSARGIPGMQSTMSTDGQDGYLGADAFYPGQLIQIFEKSSNLTTYRHATTSLEH